MPKRESISMMVGGPGSGTEENAVLRQLALPPLPAPTVESGDVGGVIEGSTVIGVHDDDTGAGEVPEAVGLTAGTRWPYQPGSRDSGSRASATTTQTPMVRLRRRRWATARAAAQPAGRINGIVASRNRATASAKLASSWSDM